MTASDRAAWFNHLKWDSEDHLAKDSSLFENSGIRFLPLDSGHWLVEIITGAGAYQQSFVFAILDEKKSVVRQLTFTDFYLNEHNKIVRHRTRFLSGRSSFDNSNNTLRIYYKGRGIGDCGSLTTFKVLPNRVQTIEARLRSCDLASSDIAPQTWEKIKLW